MNVNHIGYAVKKIENAIAHFEGLGYKFNDIIYDYERNIKISFGEKDGYRVELVCPLDETKESPVDNYLINVRATPYHICYESSCFDSDVEKMERSGYKTIIPPAPAIAFQGKRVVFMMSLSIGLIEIVEK